MKAIFSILLMVFTSSLLYAQRIIPGIELRNPDGEIISSEQILEENQAYIMIFWKSNSTKCCDFLENMQSSLLTQLNDKNIKMAAICIDHQGTRS